MRKIIIFSISIMLFLACSKSQGVDFCEGVSIEGKGVKCGKKFTTGFITLCINPKDQFGVDKISINLYETKKSKKIKKDSFTLDVKSDSSSTNHNLYFYENGDYSVEALAGEKIIGEGSVEIIDEF